jgi:hypothetical protein
VARAKTGGSGQMVAFRLPKDLHDKLTAASEATHGEGVSEEIRRRLEASFRGSENARSYLDVIGRVIRSVEDAYGTVWRDGGFARAIIWEAVRMLFEPREEGQPEFEPARPGSFIARMGERDKFRYAGDIAFMLYHFVTSEEAP